MLFGKLGSSLQASILRIITRGWGVTSKVRSNVLFGIDNDAYLYFDLGCSCGCRDCVLLKRRADRVNTPWVVTAAVDSH
jgi:hypothetical protein